MIEKSGSHNPHASEYEAHQEAAPVLAVSDAEDVHNSFIIRHRGHSAVVNVVCSPLRNPFVSWKTNHALRSVFVPCCGGLSSIYRECIYRYIGANFKPGDWIDGHCYEFDPVDEPNGTCEERTQAASNLFCPPASNRLEGAQRKANAKRKRDGSNRESTAKAKDHDAEDDTTVPRRETGKRKRNGESVTKAKDHDAEDKTTAQRLIKQLEQGIEEVMNEDVSPAAPKRFDDSLAQYHHEQRLADDGARLEEMLWKRATDVERGGKESAWMHRIMFSVCRCYRRVNQMKILADPDPAMEATQKRWEVGGQVLNEIVDRLYVFRKELALVVFRAARKKAFLYSACANVSAKRRAGIVKAIVDGLRFTPIAAALDSRVMLPPAYLSYKRGLKYSEVCTSLKLGNLADLKFPESELAKFAWEMPLSFLVGNRDDVRIINKDGVQLLTDSIPNPIITGCEGLSADERGQAATFSPFAASNANMRLLKFTSTRFKPINLQGREGLTTSNQKRQSPAVQPVEGEEDHDGDVSVRTAPALSNNPIVPADSESGAGSGHPGPVRHRDTRWPSPTLSVQEPSPIGTITAGLPWCGVGAHSHNVPPLALLLAAAGQVGGIQRLRPRDINLGDGTDATFGRLDGNTGSVQANDMNPAATAGNRTLAGVGVVHASPFSANVGGSPTPLDRRGDRLGGSRPIEELPACPPLHGVSLRQIEAAASPPQLCRSPRGGTGFALGIPEAPHVPPRESMASFSDNFTAAVESPFGTLLGAAAQAAGLDEAAKGCSSPHSESLDHFMQEVLDLPEDNTDSFLT